MICVSQKNHILHSVKIRHIKFSCCFAHILNQNKVFLFASFYRQFRNAYFPVARTGTGTQKRLELPLPLPLLFSEMFRKLSICCPRNTNCNREWESCRTTCTSTSLETIRNRIAWERWKTFNDATEVFLTLNRGPKDIGQTTRCFLERFFTRLYDKTSPQTSINLLDYKRFPQFWEQYSSMTEEKRTREVTVGVKWWKKKITSISILVGMVQEKHQQKLCSTVETWSNSKQSLPKTNKMWLQSAE